eukprot:3497894-Pyramimonas_sp.AAC.1
MRLESAGAQPAGHYGHQKHGVFGSNMLQMRRRMAHVASSAKRGRCLTSVLDLRFDNLDPEVCMPRESLKLWLTSWFANSRLRAGGLQAWPKVVSHFAGLDMAQRTRHIRGPMST